MHLYRANYTFWRTFISIPFERKNIHALSVVKAVLEPIVLRRTKNMTDTHGNPMVPLPPREINIEYLDFTPPEQDIYDSLQADSKTKFAHFCAAGKILSNYASIFQLLMRLRQVTCHPYLVLGKNDDRIQTKDGGITTLESLIERYSSQGDYSMSVLKKLMAKQSGETGEDSEADECPLCLDVADSKIMLPCMHMFCRDCLMTYFEVHFQHDDGIRLSINTALWH